MDTTFDKTAWAAKKQSARQAAYDQIEQYLDGLLMEDGRFSQYLTVQGHFPQCSVGNAILIAAQKPGATQYRTYEDWSKKNISIRKGEKSFSLLVPNGTYTGKDGRTRTNFEVQKVFDISQTNAVPKEPALNVRQNLQAFLTRPVCPVQVLDRSGGAVYVPEGNRVEIGRDLSVEETFHTLSLAFAHGELAKRIPDYQPNAPQNNLYARCISCVVCTRYGVDTRDYNFMDAPNVLGGCNNQELRQHLSVIRDTANFMVERTDKVRRNLLSQQTRTVDQGAR